MRRIFLVLGLAALAVAVVAFVATRSRGQAGKSAVPAASQRAPAATAPVPVDVLAVAAEGFEVSVPATGTLRARESVELVSELSRRLVRVRAVEGAKVKKGDVLFELDTADLLAELERLKVQIALADATSGRQKKLLAEGLSTESERETVQARHDELLAQRGVLAVTLAKALIRAPFSGTVGLRHVSEGAWVSPSTLLATLHDLSQLKLDFTLPERFGSLVTPGQRFRFSVEARGAPAFGTIQAFEPAIDPTSRSVLVRGVTDNSEAALMPGTFARVDLPLKVDQALLVPNIAIVPGSDGRRVFLEKSGVARSVLVEVGARSADRVQVLSGLSSGDRVIVSNLLRLRDGVRVRVKSDGAPK